MTTELKVLKQILEDDKKASIQLVARQLNMGNDYIRYLCRELSKKGLVKKLESQDWYEITQKGWERFEGVEKSVAEEGPSPKHISGKRKDKKKIKKKVPGEKRLKKGTKRKAEGEITKKVRRRARKEIKRKVSKVQKKGKILVNLQPRQKEIIRSESEGKAMPSKKQFEKVIKIFKNLFHIKRD